MNTENFYDHDVFLCFASADKEQAKAIYYQMSSGGLRVFWAYETLKNNIGQSFFGVIEDALTHSEHFVLICTNNSMQSKWVREEYGAFFLNAIFQAIEQEGCFYIVMRILINLFSRHS